MKGKNKRAFTLIELLVVVLIIGILAAIALPQYEKAVAKTRTTQAVVTLKAISDAQEIFYLANGQYALYLEELGLSDYNTDSFTFSCSSRRTCCAYPVDQNVLPQIEFYTQHGGSWMFQGKHWCIGYNDFTQSICKAMGTLDADPALGAVGTHYRIN